MLKVILGQLIFVQLCRFRDLQRIVLFNFLNQTAKMNGEVEGIAPLSSVTISFFSSRLKFTFDDLLICFTVITNKSKSIKYDLEQVIVKAKAQKVKSRHTRSRNTVKRYDTVVLFPLNGFGCLPHQSLPLLSHSHADQHRCPLSH